MNLVPVLQESIRFELLRTSEKLQIAQQQLADALTRNQKLEAELASVRECLGRAGTVKRAAKNGLALVAECQREAWALCAGADAGPVLRGLEQVEIALKKILAGGGSVQSCGRPSPAFSNGGES